MNEEEVRGLGNQALADLETWVRAERERRSRLSAASSDVADLLKNVKADGGDPNQVVTEALAVVEAAPLPPSMTSNKATVKSSTPAAQGGMGSNAVV